MMEREKLEEVLNFMFQMGIIDYMQYMDLLRQSLPYTK